MSENMLQRDLARLLNQYSQEQHSETPDFILARYLLGCLGVFNRAMRERAAWYNPNPSEAPENHRDSTA